ncbi:hypothetical protein [Nocardia nova]
MTSHQPTITNHTEAHVSNGKPHYIEYGGLIWFAWRPATDTEGGRWDIDYTPKDLDTILGTSEDYYDGPTNRECLCSDGHACNDELAKAQRAPLPNTATSVRADRRTDRRGRQLDHTGLIRGGLGLLKPGPGRPEQPTHPEGASMDRVTNMICGCCAAPTSTIPADWATARDITAGRVKIWRRPLDLCDDCTGHRPMENPCEPADHRCVWVTGDYPDYVYW